MRSIQPACSYVGATFPIGAKTMSNQVLICDECRRPLKTPAPAWMPPSDVVLLCKECSRVSGPAPASGLTSYVLEVEPDARQSAAA
jgi:hypothetical protein